MVRTLIYKLKRFFCKTSVRRSCNCKYNYTITDEIPLYSGDTSMSKSNRFHGYSYKKKCNLCGLEWWDNFA